jgi:hypothetical protein
MPFLPSFPPSIVHALLHSTFRPSLLPLFLPSFLPSIPSVLPDLPFGAWLLPSFIDFSFPTALPSLQRQLKNELNHHGGVGAYSHRVRLCVPSFPPPPPPLSTTTTIDHHYPSLIYLSLLDISFLPSFLP